MKSSAPSRIGWGLKEKYNEGKSIQDWIKTGFDGSHVEEAGFAPGNSLKEKKYYVVPTDPNWEKIPAGMIEFYEDPEKCPMSTPSGKLEFYSERLAKHFPDDKERPPVPHWVEKSEFHDERISSERAKKYPCWYAPTIPGGGCTPSWMMSTGSMKL